MSFSAFFVSGFITIYHRFGLFHVGLYLFHVLTQCQVVLPVDAHVSGIQLQFFIYSVRSDDVVLNVNGLDRRWFLWNYLRD